MNKSILEREARLYWCAASAGRLSARQQKDDKIVCEHADELEVIGLNTTSPKLRTLCFAAIISLVAPLEALAAELAVECVEVLACVLSA